MISSALIRRLKDEIEKKDTARSKVISATHGIVREAKHAIFMLHRGEPKKALSALKDIEKRLKHIVKEASDRGLRGEGTLKAAIEEYLEALFFLRIVQGKPLPSKFVFITEADEQLAALSDLTGELVRAATLEATKGNFRSIQRYRDATEELFGVLLSMNLRGNLRQKRDEARRNLRRLEEILYDVSLKG